MSRKLTYCAILVILIIDHLCLRLYAQTNQSRPSQESTTVDDSDSKYLETKKAFDTQDYESANRLAAELASVGDSRGYNILGLLYKNGLGRNKNEKEGIRLITAAANNGLAQAQANLCGIYQDGAGVTKDPSISAAWCRKAADQGLLQAQLVLGQMYSRGFGVVKDAEQAVAWFRRAADKGYAPAEVALGDTYWTGDGVEKDQSRAMLLYQKAAGQGDPYAEAMLKKIADAQEKQIVQSGSSKGAEFAEKSGTTWSVREKKNEMTDSTDVDVVSLQGNENGVEAEVRGTCAKSKKVTFTALIADENGKATINLPSLIRDSYNEGSGPSLSFHVDKWVSGEIRIDDEKASNANFPLAEFENKIVIATEERPKPDRPFGDLAKEIRQGSAAFSYVVDIGHSWRILAQLETSAGTILIKIPLADQAIQNMISSCHGSTR